jgi:hypothetical protein
MNRRQVFVTEALVLALTLVLISLSGDTNFGGFFAGYTAGIGNHLLWARDARRVGEMSLERAVIEYIKGLFTRLALITIVVAFVWRVAPGWVFALAGGIALGVVIPLVLVVRRELTKKGGET